MTDINRTQMIISWSDEDKVYLAHAPELGVITHGDTELEALTMLLEAISLHNESVEANEHPITGEDIKHEFLVNNPHLRAILKILRSKKWTPLEFNIGQGRISFCLDILEEPKKANDWGLHILVVPDLNNPDHQHYNFQKNQIMKIHKFLGKILTQIEKLK